MPVGVISAVKPSAVDHIAISPVEPNHVSIDRFDGSQKESAIAYSMSHRPPMLWQANRAESAGSVSGAGDKQAPFSGLVETLSRGESASFSTRTSTSDIFHWFAPNKFGNFAMGVMYAQKGAKVGWRVKSTDTGRVMTIDFTSPANSDHGIYGLYEIDAISHGDADYPLGKGCLKQIRIEESAGKLKQVHFLISMFDENGEKKTLPGFLWKKVKGSKKSSGDVYQFSLAGLTLIRKEGNDDIVVSFDVDKFREGVQLTRDDAKQRNIHINASTGSELEEIVAYLDAYWREGLVRDGKATPFQTKVMNLAKSKLKIVENEGSGGSFRSGAH